MAYTYQQVGPYTCNGGEHQSVTITGGSGAFISIGVQNNTGSASSFYPSQMYISASNKAFIEVVNTGSDYTNWSAWLVIDTSGSATNVGVNITASFESAKN